MQNNAGKAFNNQQSSCQATLKKKKNLSDAFSGNNVD